MNKKIITYIFLSIFSIALIVYYISLKWIRLNILLRNSEELTFLFKSCENINHGDSINTLYKKMKGFNFSDMSIESRTINFYTSKHSADLCSVSLEEKQDFVKKVDFLID